ncbi:hypothetical protein GA0074695_3013 [Micromonospora viridifaciens]|uniref:Polyketide cyclase / dehydrase and lipid transport n=1 Tax=Micromonospora viridifaciens TaxID=1881 RepID=A0A1C4X4X7_MICVI|nr:hypothetical protein [Micromonospora viridifaciens]SCF03505.1 hypothetical protein GA0074695_3013 [Micromonospora viridifaciens]
MWNATPEEVTADYPCDRHLTVPFRSFVRAVDVAAPVPVVYRWLCQLKVAPYSYDLVDNLGRRSPRTLTPGAEDLAVGQKFLIFEVVEFVRDEHLTGLIAQRHRRSYGEVAVTYRVTPCATGTRLVGRLDVGATTAFEQARRAALAVGDALMGRKQLLTIKELAEASVNTE